MALLNTAGTSARQESTKIARSILSQKFIRLLLAFGRSFIFLGGCTRSFYDIYMQARDRYFKVFSGHHILMCYNLNSSGFLCKEA